MLKYPYITELGKYLNEIIPEGKLSLNGKDTVDYDKLLNEIYQFAKKTERKDGESPGNRAQALKIACEKMIHFIDNEAK